jgi:hypothetical protein
MSAIQMQLKDLKWDKARKVRSKRPCSAQRVFRNAMRKQVQDELVEAAKGVKVTSCDLWQELAKRWKALPEEEKQVYKDEAINTLDWWMEGESW